MGNSTAINIGIATGVVLVIGGTVYVLRDKIFPADSKILKILSFGSNTSTVQQTTGAGQAIISKTPEQIKEEQAREKAEKEAKASADRMAAQNAANNAAIEKAKQIEAIRIKGILISQGLADASESGTPATEDQIGMYMFLDGRSEDELILGSPIVSIVDKNKYRNGTLQPNDKRAILIKTKLMLWSIKKAQPKQKAGAPVLHNINLGYIK